MTPLFVIAYLFIGLITTIVIRQRVEKKPMTLWIWLLTIALWPMTWLFGLIFQMNRIKI